MKKRIHFLAFLGIFIFMIIPKNVYAESLIPGWASLNGTTFVANGEPLAKDIFFWVGDTGTNGTNGNKYVDIQVDAMFEDDLDRNDYPYVMLYVLSQTKYLTAKRNASCNTTCFSDSINLGVIGKSTYKNREMYFYAVILPINKMYYDDNRAMYRVTDVIRFSVPDTYYLTAFTNIWFTKDGDILNSAYIGRELDNLQLNNNTNTNSIINNQNTNTQTIINNQNTNQQQTHDDLNNINNSLKDESGVAKNDVSSKTTEWTNKLAGTGPVSQMVLMPITLLNGYVSGMNATCQPYNLGNLMGTDIILPCINVSNYLGATLWNVIDVLFSGFMIYAMGKKFVKIFNDFTNLRDNQMDELYGGGK